MSDEMSSFLTMVPPELMRVEMYFLFSGLPESFEF
jgi:hypothetical protein